MYIYIYILLYIINNIYIYIIIVFSSYRFLGRQRIGSVKVQAKLKCNARGYYTTPSGVYSC